MLYNWGGSQTGFAVVFTPRNSSGRTPWVEVSDVEFSGNTLAHSGSAFNLLGHDDTDRSGQLARVVLRNNLVYDIDGGAWAGNGNLRADRRRADAASPSTTTRSCTPATW